MTGTANADLRRRVACRLAAFGVITRLTGHDSIVTVDENGLTLDDGENFANLTGAPAADENANALNDLPTTWLSDASAERVAVDWIEDYLEDTYQFLVIRRDYITDLISDPFSELYLERLAYRFPHPGLDELHAFLANVEHWLNGQEAAA